MGKVIDDDIMTFLVLTGAIRVIAGRPATDFLLRRAVGKKEHLLFFELFCKSSAWFVTVSGPSLITTSTADSPTVGSLEEEKELTMLQFEIDEILSI